MVLNLKEFKDICSKILFAIDSSDGSQLTDTLSIVVSDGVLHLSATNREYYTSIKMNVGDVGEFKASVNAGMFLKLVSSLTSETIELDIFETYLKVKSNGTFKLPLIFNGDSLLELPEIVIDNKTQEFNIKTENLLDILNYNSKEVTKKTRYPVQKLYYLDQNGCITFTTGACVNKFELDGTVSILLTPKVVKLFKLFSSDTVKFELGYDEVGDGVLQTKVCFSNDSVKISAILPSDESLIKSVPAELIRKTAFNQFEYSVDINKDLILNSIKRFLIFTNDPAKCVVSMKFDQTGLTITDEAGNSEFIKYGSEVKQDFEYTAKLFADDLRLTLESVTEAFVVVNFGNHKAVVINKGNIYNVIPEVVQN